jgi:hypothetical protein
LGRWKTEEKLAAVNTSIASSSGVMDMMQGTHEADPKYAKNFIEAMKLKAARV